MHFNSSFFFFFPQYVVHGFRNVAETDIRTLQQEQGFKEEARGSLGKVYVRVARL